MRIANGIAMTVAIILTCIQPAMGQVHIMQPEIGDNRVTIAGVSVPTLPGQPPKQGRTNAVIVVDSTAKGTTLKRYDDRALLFVVNLYPSQKAASTESPTIEYRSQATTYITGTSSVDASLGAPWTEGSAIVAIDLHRMSMDSAVQPREKAMDVTNPTFGATGFDEGSATVEFTNLPEGEELRSSRVIPSIPPITSFLRDGGTGDLDNTEDGSVTIDLPQDHTPPHVLSGEILVVALHGEQGELGVFFCDGTGARLVVPVVSHIVGSTGIPFISDLALSNPFGYDENGWIRFIPEGSTWNDGTEASFSLTRGSSLSFTDVLQSAFGISDNLKGTLIVGGTPGWTVLATSRNYAVDADSRRFGIAVPGLRTLCPLTPDNRWLIPGLRQDLEMRSNLILAGAVPQDSIVMVRVIVAGQVAGSRQVRVPGYGLFQINRVAASLGAGTVTSGYIELEVESGAVFGTLSVVDGSADDAALILPEPMLPRPWN